MYDYEYGAEPMESQVRYAEGATQEERVWALACHLTALTIFVGIPLGNVLGPLLAWLIKKDAMPLVDDQGKESLNFQLSLLIYTAVAWIPVVLIIGLPLLPLSILVTLAVAIFGVVMTIIGGLKAYEGEYYRYPLTLRLIT
jgi:uncharacterized Tic20 family protein